MKKGITPIISIIILLLITVGLAAAAWTYMGNYFTGLTANVIEVPTQKCIGGIKLMAVVHNIGTSALDVDGDDADLVIFDSDGNSPSAVSWSSVQGTAFVNNQKIDPGDYAKVTIDTPTCTDAGTPATCTYEFIVGGRPTTVTVYCPG